MTKNRNSKRYYWLKLKEDFFEDDTIEWIEEQENGERYVLFYLKLCLKSIKDEGNLIRYVGEKLIPYDVKSLAKLTNTDQDTVAVSLKVFEEIGLIERTGAGEIYMKQINEMIGTETDSARRVRKHRARQNQLGENDSNPQRALQCNNDATKSNTEIEREIEIDIDIETDIDIEIDIEREEEMENTPNNLNSDFKEIAQLYQQVIGQPNGLTPDWINSILKDFGFEWVKNAMLESEKRGKRNKSYVEAILQNWKTEGGMRLGGKLNGANREKHREDVDEYAGIGFSYEDLQEMQIGEDSDSGDVG